VPPVGHLPGTRAGARRCRSVGAAAIPRDRLDARMRRQPLLNGASGAIEQQVDDAPTLQVADDGTVAVSAPPRSIVDTDDMRLQFGADLQPAAHQSEQG